MHEAVLLRRWLSALRIVTGGIFVYIGTQHVLGGWATPEVLSQVIGRFVASSPFGWYTATIGSLVLSAPSVFGPLFAFGMVATGLGLAFGALTRVAIVAGLWLNLNNFLMGFGGGGVHHGINVLMAVVQVTVWHTGAWRWHSIDGLLGGRTSRSAEATHADARV